MLINLESFTEKSIHQLLRDFYTTRSLSLRKSSSSWNLRPPSQRSILNSWIAYQSPHLDSSIASHIHPKRMYRPKLSLHVLSASRFMVFPVASLLSVKRVSLSSQLPRNHLGSKLLSNTSPFSTTLLCRLCFSILHQFFNQAKGTCPEVTSVNSMSFLNCKWSIHVTRHDLFIDKICDVFRLDICRWKVLRNKCEIDRWKIAYRRAK